MSLYDRLVPAEALRWGRLTRPWLELDAWMRANPAIGDRIDGLALWESLPPQVHFMRTGEYATGGLIPKATPIVLTQADFPLIRPTPPRFSWLPWRKRR